MVLASSPELIEDVKKAPEDILSVSIPRTEASLLLGLQTYIHIDSSAPSV